MVSTRLERASFDPRPVHLRTVDPEMEQRRLVQLLGECKGVKSGLLDTLPCFGNCSDTSTDISTRQLHCDVRTVQQLVTEVRPPPARESDSTPSCDAGSVHESFVSSLKLTDQQIHALEYRTRGQASNQLWLQHRFGRLTASNFGKIVKRTAPMLSLVEQLLHKPPPPASLQA